jgi:uncharacterized protein YgbK (DUF1537 family)
MIEREPATKPAAPLLGCVADDFTGATDLALNLVQGGMRVVQWLEVPNTDDLTRIEADALVVALKSRSIPPEEAVEMSLRSLARLQDAGCRRFYFKYCSTFDSTSRGNIGPVAEALMAELNCEQAIFCPAFPDVGRTVYRGHLFVHDKLLNESGMENHPLNPMRDSSLVRLLASQSRASVGLLPYDKVAAGPETITDSLQQLLAAGKHLVVVDALDVGHLRNIAAACGDLPLVTGGSGLARYLPAVYRALRLLEAEPFSAELPVAAGRQAIISGSCSAATQAQVSRQLDRSAAWQVNIKQLMEDAKAQYEEIARWAQAQPTDAILMVYSTASAAAVSAAQQQFGREPLAAAVEQLLARVARLLVKQLGVRQLIVAGGETASAVASALKLTALRIGPEIAPGVPWTESLGEPPLALALKSGNFGAGDFFQTALEMLR